MMAQADYRETGSDRGTKDFRRPVRIWLICVCALIVAMILVGGATRLTDSGLSITEWKPIHGMIPPLSVEQMILGTGLSKESGPRT